MGYCRQCERLTIGFLAFLLVGGLGGLSLAALHDVVLTHMERREGPFTFLDIPKAISPGELRAVTCHAPDV